MSDRVRITSRYASGIKGHVAVEALVDGAESGTYQIAETLVGTQREVDEIIEQATARAADRDATRPGRD